MDKGLIFLQQKIKDVQGYLREDEAKLLYNLAKRCRNRGVIVEIGSWQGKSTICLAIGSKDGPKSLVYAIDSHTGSKEHRRKYGPINTLKIFKQNIKKAEVFPYVKTLVTTSQKAAQKFYKPIELIFIDGSHDYQTVKSDFQSWWPHIINGGVMAFHDTLSWPGPRKVVEKYLFKSFNFKNIQVIGSITYGQKTNYHSFLDQIRNRYVLLLMNFRRAILKNKLPRPLHQLAKKIYYHIQ